MQEHVPLWVIKSIDLSHLFGGLRFLLNCNFAFCPEEKRYYICHCMSSVFLWCHFVVFAALPDIIKWIDISNICGAQRALIQWRWTLGSSHCGTASGVCLFNHSCWNKIRKQCVAKPLTPLSQQREVGRGPWQQEEWWRTHSSQEAVLSHMTIHIVCRCWWG